MAIKKIDAAKLSGDELLHMEKAEEMIDDHLSHTYLPDPLQTTISLRGPKLTLRVREALMQRYRDAGWTVEFVADLEGGFLRFT